jgi:peptidyl-prolyl cis-trans isomerase C
LSKFSVFVSAIAVVVCLQQAAYAGTVLIVGPEVELTVEDVEKTLSTVAPDQRSALKASPQKLRGVMDSTYITKVLAHRARQNNLQNEPEVADDIWHKTQNILAAAQTNKVLKDGRSKAADLEAASKERYAIDQKKYITPEEVEASHILLKAEDGQSDEALLAETKRIRDEIVSGSISFEDAAEKYSKDSGSAAKQGSLGKFGKGRMVKPFENAVFALANPGDISEPVKTRFGYHLIRLDAKHPSVQRSYAEVKDEIIKQILAKQRKAIRETYLLEIRDDPTVKLDQPAIDAFLADPNGSK